MKPKIDLEALRKEMNRLKETPDVKAYHKARATLAGASCRGEKKAYWKGKKKIDATS